MKSLSRNDAQQWCIAQGAVLSERGFPVPSGKSISFGIPVDAGQRVALVADHLQPFQSTDGVLVWFHDWAVWPSGQRMHIFERFAASYGQSQPLIERPAFLFSRAEYEDLVSIVTIGILFLWDVYVVGAKASRLVFYSHDEVGWRV